MLETQNQQKVKTMKNEKEIEILAKNSLEFIEKFVFITSTKEDENLFCDGFIIGYKKCQMDNFDKKYTEEDLLHAFREGVLLPNSQIGIMEDIFKQVVHSINKQ